ncbi:MAG: hypothetical protein QXW60_07290 [Nitrososphaerota archaeon]
MSQKQQTRQAEKSKPAEKRVLSVTVSNISEVESFVQSQPYLTPYVIAEKFGVRLSIAKRLLRGLAEKGVIRPIENVARLKLYAPTKEVKITPHKPQIATRKEEEAVAETPAPKKTRAKGGKAKAK